MPPLYFALLLVFVIAAAGVTIAAYSWLGLPFGLLAGAAMVFSLWLHRQRSRR